MRYKMKKYAIIGDIHSCFTELINLTKKIVDYDKGLGSRQFVFVGDLVDRGPNSISVIREVKALVNSGQAIFTPGNHDNKFARYLKGNNIIISHGLDKTIEQWKKFSEMFPHLVNETKNWFIDYVLGHKGYEVLDNGNLVVAHAGIKDEQIGKENKRVLSMCLYGDVTGNSSESVIRDENGNPIRKDWAAERQVDHPLIVHGHTVVDEVSYKNGVYCIDTGCVYGNKLTALMYPEKDLLQVNALKTYTE